MTALLVEFHAIVKILTHLVIPAIVLGCVVAAAMVRAERRRSE